MFNSLSLDGISLLKIQQRDNCDTCGDKDSVSQHTSWTALCRAGSRVSSSPGMRRPNLTPSTVARTPSIWAAARAMRASSPASHCMQKPAKRSASAGLALCSRRTKVSRSNKASGRAVKRKVSLFPRWILACWIACSWQLHNDLPLQAAAQSLSWYRSNHMRAEARTQYSWLTVLPKLQPSQLCKAQKESDTVQHF